MDDKNQTRQAGQRKAPFSHRLKVRWNECDAHNVVFNAIYLNYFDIALAECWRAFYRPWTEMASLGLDAVVAEITTKYRQPAHFENELDIEAGVVHVGTTSFTFRMNVMRGEDLLAEGRLRYVMLDWETRHKKPIPHDLREAMATIRWADE